MNGGGVCCGVCYLISIGVAQLDPSAMCGCCSNSNSSHGHSVVVKYLGNQPSVLSSANHTSPLCWAGPFIKACESNLGTCDQCSHIKLGKKYFLIVSFSLV